MLHRLSAVALVSLSFNACDSKPPPPAATPTAVTAPDPALAEATLQAWNRAARILIESAEETQILRDALTRFLSEPTADTLGACRLAWQRAHQHYVEFGPLLALSSGNPGLFGRLEALNFNLDAWPIQPGFLDYFDVYTQSGIVNDIAMPLTAQALRQQHGFTDASDVSLGFHALEYLLWGEAGNRPATDYENVSELSPEQRAAGMTVVELPSNRRRVLLQLLGDLLLDDLKELQQQWNDPEGPLRQNYLALQPQSRLRALQDAGRSYLQTVTARPTTTDQETGNTAGADAEAATSNPTAEAVPGNSVAASEAVHNQYADANPELLAHALLTIETLLLNKEDGLGRWILDTEAEADLIAAVRRQREILLTWHDKPWPPESDDNSEILSTLERLNTALAYGESLIPSR